MASHQSQAVREAVVDGYWRAFLHREAHAPPLTEQPFSAVVRTIRDRAIEEYPSDGPERYGHEHGHLMYLIDVVRDPAIERLSVAQIMDVGGDHADDYCGWETAPCQTQS